jgi:hypothetical protein
MTKEQDKRLEGLADALNAALKGDNYAAILSARAALNVAIAEENEAAKQTLYKKCLKSKTPMIAALTEGYITLAKVSTKKDSTTGAESVKMGTKLDVVDIVDFEDSAEGRLVSANAQWRYWVEAYTKTLTKRVMSKVAESEAMDTFAAEYKQSKLSAGIKLSEPKTDAEALKLLQQIIDAIVFEAGADGKNTYAATLKDVAYLEFLMCNKGKGKYAISTPRVGKVTEIISILVSRIVTKSAYDAEFAKITKK